MKSKAFWGVFLVLAILLVMQINPVSAFEFDNVKDYNAETKTVTINNCDLWIGTCLNVGEEIANIKLDSELEVFVIAGKDRKVAG